MCQYLHQSFFARCYEICTLLALLQRLCTLWDHTYVVLQGYSFRPAHYLVRHRCINIHQRKQPIIAKFYWYLNQKYIFRNAIRYQLHQFFISNSYYILTSTRHIYFEALFQITMESWREITSSNKNKLRYRLLTRIRQSYCCKGSALRKHISYLRWQVISRRH